MWSGWPLVGLPAQCQAGSVSDLQPEQMHIYVVASYHVKVLQASIICRVWDRLDSLLLLLLPHSCSAQSAWYVTGSGTLQTSTLS